MRSITLDNGDTVKIVGCRFLHDGEIRHRCAATAVDNTGAIEEAFIENGEENWEELSRTKDVEIRKMVAMNGECLDKLSSDKNPHVRERAIQIKNIQPK